MCGTHEDVTYIHEQTLGLMPTRAQTTSMRQCWVGWQLGWSAEPQIVGCVANQQAAGLMCWSGRLQNAWMDLSVRRRSTKGSTHSPPLLVW